METYRVSELTGQRDDEGNILDLGKVNEIEVDFDKLKSHIITASWSPATFTGNRRLAVDFKAASMIGLDIDGGMSLNAAKAIAEPYKHIIAPTRNNQKAKNGITCDRFRVILFTSQPITENVTFKNTWFYLQELFKNAVDPATKDSSRYFFPSTSIFSSNQEGLLITPITSKVEFKDKAKLLKPPTEPVLDDKLKRVNPAALIQLASEPPADGSWHVQMRRLWGWLRDASLSEKEIVQISEDYLSKYGMSLDPTDLIQISDTCNRWQIKGGPGKKMTAKDFFNKAKEDVIAVLKDKFVVVTEIRDKQAGKVEAAITGENEVKLVSADAVQDYYAEQAVGTDYEHSSVEYKKLCDTWRSQTSSLGEPVIVSLNDRKTLAYKHLTIDINDGPTPLFDKIMSATANALPLQAFLWSVLEKKSYNQQLLIWHGAGGDGKSSVMRLMQILLDSSYAGASSKDLESSHFTATLIGKRFLVFSDENNPKLLMSGAIKKFTGEDSHFINPKGKPGYSAKLPLKVAILTNHEPEFDSMKANLRRIIYCPIVQEIDRVKDANYAEKLEAELPHVLFKCREAYNTLCPEHEMIPCDYGMAESIVDQYSKTERKFIAKYLEIDKDSCITNQEFIELCDKIDPTSGNDKMKKIKVYLTNRHKVFARSNEQGVVCLYGIRLKTR